MNTHRNARLVLAKHERSESRGSFVAKGAAHCEFCRGSATYHTQSGAYICEACAERKVNDHA